MSYGPLKASVSSLFYVDNFELLLVGTGGHVELFDLKESRSLQTLPIFKNTTHTPHGFVQEAVNEEAEFLRFIVYGGKFIRCIQLNVKEKQLLEVESGRYEFSDWILDVCLWKKKIYAVTAHNEICVINKVQEERLDTKEIVLKPNEKCILYSACIVCDNPNELAIIGGTVFKQVIVYSCTGSEESDLTVSHRLDGHEGVIFDLQYHKESSLICSTSDDRTVSILKLLSKNQTFFKKKMLHF